MISPDYIMLAGLVGFVYFYGHENEPEHEYEASVLILVRLLGCV